MKQTDSQRGETRGCSGGQEQSLRGADTDQDPQEASTTSTSVRHALMTIMEGKKERKRKKRKHSSDQRLHTTDPRIPTNPKQDLTRKKKVLKIRKSREIKTRRDGGTWLNTARRMKSAESRLRGFYSRTNNPASITNYLNPSVN